MKLAIIAIVAVIYGIIISIPNVYIQSVLADSSSSSHDGGGGKSDDNKGKSDDNKGKSDDGGGGKSDDGGGGKSDDAGSATGCKSCASFSKPIISSSVSNDNVDNKPHLRTPSLSVRSPLINKEVDVDADCANCYKITGVQGAETLNDIPSSSNSGSEGPPSPAPSTNNISPSLAKNAKTANDIRSSSGVGNDLRNTDPNSNPNNPFGTSSGIQSTNTTSSRDELLDKVSSPEELQTILAKFKSFVEDTSVSSVVNSSLGKVSTAPTSSYGVSYSWEPTNTIMKEEHSILMLKFTDAAGNIIKNSNIDYDILIKDPNTNNIVFQKHGSTPTGVDLKIIDGNSFPIGVSQSNRINYNVEVGVNSIGGNIVSEHASLPKVAVISYNPQ
jgi:hypothetical protein